MSFDGANRYLQFSYNNQGLPITVTGTNGTLQTVIYDALNRPIKRHGCQWRDRDQHV